MIQPQNYFINQRSNRMGMTTVTILFLLGLFISNPVFSQKLHQGEWKTYTAMSEVTDLAVNRASGNIWAATTGGAFRFTPSAPTKDHFLALRNSDGVSDNDLTAVAADSNGKIYFGGSGGKLDVYCES